ncbi:MAG: hypothetical protein MK106_02140 [Mariniblastus sp.]|nr:hypothetical protein [Mariniblastus sp.]
MQSYEHEFSSIEEYLHHRTPYLLVKQIESVEKNCIVTRTSFDGDEFFVPGHFPGAPILPGALMQEMTTQSAGILIAARHNPMQEYCTADPFFNEYALGVLVRVRNARYRGFARPGDQLTITITLSEQVGQVFDFVGKISNGQETILRNEFQLANIPSKALQGAVEPAAEN